MDKKMAPVCYVCPTCEINGVRRYTVITQVVEYPNKFYWHCPACQDGGYRVVSPRKRDLEFWSDKRKRHKRR